MIASRRLLPLIGLILPIALLTLWWVISARNHSFYFPPLQVILERFSQEWLASETAAQIIPTLGSFFLGYFLAAVVGIGLGVVLALMPRTHHFFSPLLELLRALPGLALIPIFISALGVGISTRIVLVLFGAVWPILLNTIDGIRGLDGVVRDTAASYRLPLADRLRYVLLPAASPQIFVGLKVALSIAVIVVIATEMIVSTAGIGHVLLEAQASFDLVGMWSALILLGILGYLLNVVFDLIERRILRWYRYMNDGSTQ